MLAAKAYVTRPNLVDKVPQRSRRFVVYQIDSHPGERSESSQDILQRRALIAMVRNPR